MTVKEVRRGPRNTVTTIREYNHPCTGTFWEDAHNAVSNLIGSDLRLLQVAFCRKRGTSNIVVCTGKYETLRDQAIGVIVTASRTTSSKVGICKVAKGMFEALRGGVVAAQTLSSLSILTRLCSFVGQGGPQI